MTDGTRAPTREIGDDATAEVAERAREELVIYGGTQLPLVAGTALLLVEPQTWTAGTWLGTAGFLLLVAGTAVWQFGTRRGREDRAEDLLAEYAVLRAVDPGVGRREAATPRPEATCSGVSSPDRCGWALSPSCWSSAGGTSRNGTFRAPPSWWSVSPST